MIIDNSKVKAIFEFSADEYFLCKSDNDMLGKYSLNYRIDRSEKGKCDDVGMPRIYISEKEAEICRKSGFSEVI